MPACSLISSDFVKFVSFVRFVNQHPAKAKHKVSTRTTPPPHRRHPRTMGVWEITYRSWLTFELPPPPPAAKWRGRKILLQITRLSLPDCRLSRARLGRKGRGER